MKFAVTSDRLPVEMDVVFSRSDIPMMRSSTFEVTSLATVDGSPCWYVVTTYTMEKLISGKSS